MRSLQHDRRTARHRRREGSGLIAGSAERDCFSSLTHRTHRDTSWGETAMCRDVSTVSTQTARGKSLIVPTPRGPD
jgi:hypothetical protein